MGEKNRVKEEEERKGKIERMGGGGRETAEEEVRRLGGLAERPPAGAAWAARVAGAPGCSPFRAGAAEWEGTRALSDWRAVGRPRRHWAT